MRPNSMPGIRSYRKINVRMTKLIAPDGTRMLANQEYALDLAKSISISLRANKSSRIVDTDSFTVCSSVRTTTFESSGGLMGAFAQCKNYPAYGCLSRTWIGPQMRLDVSQ